MKKYILIALAVFCFMPASVHAASADEQRELIKVMRTDTLARLYQLEPATRAEVINAVGYAVFSSADVAAIFVSASVGHGLAHDNRTKDETFMRMASAGIGLGAGLKDFNTVFIFEDADAFDHFVEDGLDLSGNIDIAAKQGMSGGAASGAADILPGVKIYQLTDAGLMAQLMIKGTKYWKDTDLNAYEQHSDAAPLFVPVQ